MSSTILWSQEVKRVVSTELEVGFKNPPNEAKARTWWHWLSGHVSMKGITADLEAMKQVGIQEAQLFNVHLDIPHGPVTYLSEEWLELFHFAAKEAKRLDLELGFHNGPGWSSSGGPWVTPEQAMQTVVFSEIEVEGRQSFNNQLPQPQTKLGYYQDIAVLAFPKPKKDIKIDGLDYKNLSERIRNHLLPDAKPIDEAAIVKKEAIIELTSRFSEDGILEWKVPKGDWIILRLGHTPTGMKNRPAPEDGSGLEVDKMSKKALDAYWAAGIQPIINKLGDLIGTTVNNCIIDSYEVETTNWTLGFDNEFKNLRGYDLSSYLPTLAGYYVDSGEVTERFLWDFRRTIGDLIAKNYYEHFGELCRKNGMKFSVEPYWGPFDNMQVGATGDIVMCEFWSGGYPFFDSPKFVSSIAHLNGSPIVGAESFTGIGGWNVHPAMLKSIGDRAWAEGITRFIFHSYVHQPFEVAPGFALSYHGTEFNRLNTWWKQSSAFMDYIARSQFLLQHGKSVADVLVFTGESSPNTAFLKPEIKALGYDYDLLGSNKIKELYVKDGKIYTAHSGPYEVLALTDSQWMKAETLRKINGLVADGATVIGTKPKKSPSLEDYTNGDTEIDQLANALWERGAVKATSIKAYLEQTKTPPDVKLEGDDVSDISFIHRTSEQADMYFIANARKEGREFIGRFRVAGKQPELWNTETGVIKEVPVFQQHEDGTTSVPLRLGMEEAVFVVFRKPITNGHFLETKANLEKPSLVPLSNLSITKAEYGTFLQEGLVDITDRVSKAIKNGTLDFQMSRGFCDCDPAMGYKKKLRMEYRIGEDTHILNAEEREHIHLDAGDKELKILKAVFGKFKAETKGVPGKYKIHDITSEIKAMVASGNIDIPIRDELIGNRPLDGNNTALRITFSKDGEEQTRTIPKGGMLKLSKDVPTTEFMVKDKKVYWATPYPGTLAYTTVDGKQKSVVVKSVPAPMDLSTDWDVSFPISKRAEKKTTFSKLQSWTTSADTSIRYFSGTASYKKQFQLPKKMLGSDTRLWLDLGSVGVIAEVIVNGKNAGILWKAPFRLPIDKYVILGKNTLEIKVTNVWPNRLIGDEQLPLDYERNGKKLKSLPEWLTNNTKRPTDRTTFSSWSHWEKDDTLLNFGLLGPVTLIPIKLKTLQQ
ncbi:hypothetical protein EJ994_10265 [Maribacter sp. MJ134]|nr:hypothetical protein EJ994_10265 [Maribacter sp. MJ134]